MISESSKMRTITGLVFCALVMSFGIMMVEGTVYSSIDTALKFSQCMIDKMGGSSFFTSDDLKSMTAVKDVLAQALLKTEQTPFSAKILVTSFITSLADVIIHDDPSRNANRKQLYSSALRQCSLWSVGYEDVDFINEAQKILSIIEQNRAMTHEELIFSGVGNPASGALGSVPYAQMSGINKPYVVQPSPVQNPSASQYFFSNSKTFFDQQEKPQFPAIVSSPRVNFNSQYAVQSSIPVDLSSSFGTRIQIRSGNYPQTFNLPSTSQTGGSFSSISASSLQNQNSPIRSEVSGIPQFENNFRGPYPENFPFNYDATRIPDTSVGQLGTSSYPESSQTSPVGDTSQINSGGLTIPQEKESTVIVIPPNTDQQYVSEEYLSQNQQHGIETEMPQTSSLENEKLEVSPSVTNTPAQNPYSESTSSQTLESIIFNILMNSREFRDTFSSEISLENAIILAQAITEQTFADYDLNVKNDALDIVTSEITKVTVPTTENFALALSNALVLILRRHDTSLSPNQSLVAGSFVYQLENSKEFYPQLSTVKKQSQDYYTSEIPGGQYYTQTETIQKQSQDYNTGEAPGEFNPQTETIQNQPQDYSTGEIVLSDYGENQRDFDFQSPPSSPENRKGEMFSLSLAEYLSNSEAMLNFFCDDNEPEDKIQISFSIIKASLRDYGSHIAPIAASIASGALSELSKEGLCNNYAKTISEIIAEILEENGIENTSAENIASKMELDLIQRQIPPTEPQNPPTKTESFATIISKTATNAGVREGGSPLTSTEEINPQNEEMTEKLSPITSSDAQAVSSTENSSPVTLQQTSTSFSTDNLTKSPEVWTTDGVIDQEALADYLTEAFELLESYIFEDSTEEYKNIDNLSTTETSSDHFDEDGDKISYQQNEGETPQEEKGYTYSTDSNVQMSTIELQPSFQEPVPNSENSNGGFLPGNISPSTVFARQVSETAESSIAYIRSPNFDMNNLCTQINQLAPLVNIPVLDHCDPIAAIDYLLNVLDGAVRILN